MSDQVIPVFPLYTVLFPGGPLPLRVFEPRYLDMISRCLRTGSDFGVCLIREGAEVGEAASTYEVGTTARIVDWHQRQDGLLGITVHGGRRFRVVNETIQPNQLLTAEVDYLPEASPVTLPEEFAGLADILRDMMGRLHQRYARLDAHYDDADWVSHRLAEVLPLGLAQKQYFLQLDDPLERLERLEAVLETLELQY